MPEVSLSSGVVHYRLDEPSPSVSASFPDQIAPLIVLSNSLGTNLSMWKAQATALAKQFRVLRYDTRGHGLSAVPPGPYSMEDLGRDALDLMDELEIERAHFCGISMGGMIGIWIGLHAPERLHKLVLCNTAARIGSAETWNTRIAAVREGGMESVLAAVVERWFTKEFVARAPQRVAAVRRSLLETPALGYVACCEGIRDADFTETVSRIKMPTLVITGSHDAATPPAGGRFLAQNIFAARYLELPASHLSNIEAEQPFTEGLLQFLSSP